MKKTSIILLALLALISCRKDIVVAPTEQTQITTGSDTTTLQGFYLLNEGNMGSNKATLDYYDFTTGVYHSNIYAQNNPNVVMELGDVGNDLQIYGSQLYAVINASNKIEVMNAQTAKRIGQINVPNCRCLAFSGQYGYVTSYAGPISLDQSHAQKGYVLKFDTATLQTIDTCLVSYQPEGLVIVDNKLFVVNSGGYMQPKYDSVMSVIDIATFKEIKRVVVDINMQHIIADKYNHLWINTQGNYYDRPSCLYCVDASTCNILAKTEMPVSNMYLEGDSLYFYSTAWSYIENKNAISFGIINVRTKETIAENIITDGTQNEIEMPYGICVNPQNKDLYITDAKNYVVPGSLSCYDSTGKRRWTIRTGDVPAHFALLYKIK